MSIEVVLHPQRASLDGLRRLLKEFKFEPTSHLRDWPKGSLHFHWFQTLDYESFDGVEATIFSPSEEEKAELGQCNWALHTRTRASASSADRQQQNKVIRIARAQFGGNFYNDSRGRNRYIEVESDRRDAVARGIFLAYHYVTGNVSEVRFTLPEPLGNMEKLAGNELEPLTTLDPTRVLYNALVPFAVAALEHFFIRCFKVLLQYDSKAQERLKNETKKVKVADILLIQSNVKSVEDIIAGWYSFQNIDSIHKAFHEWFGINFREILRKRRKVGRRLPFLEDQIKQLIDTRHGVVHRFSIDRQLRKEDIQEILDLVLAVIEVFVDYLESSRGTPIRD